MTRARAQLRLAWRLARSARARSALVALLVALPVVVGTFVVVAYRTAQLSPEQAAVRYLGHADAVAVVTPQTRLEPSVSAVGRGPSYSGETIEMTNAPTAPTDGGAARDAVAVDLPRLLPAGAHAVITGLKRSVTVSRGARSADTVATVHDFTDPMTAPLYRLVAGHPPTSVGQVALTRALARRLHARVGDRVALAGQLLLVTAVVRDPSALSSEEILGSATSLGGLSSFANNGFGQEVTWLIDFPGRAPDLHGALAAHGVLYETRAQWEHPSRELATSSRVNPETVAIVVSIVGFGVIEIVLLAGTAVAVGTRRQIRDLGLLRAVGGDESDVRRSVLGQGVLLGVAGGIVGAAAGIVAVVTTRSQLERYVDRAFGPLDVPWKTVLVVMVGAVVASLLAAAVPARSSARLAVVDMVKTRFPADGRPRTPWWAAATLVIGPGIVVVAAIGFHQRPSNAPNDNTGAFWTSLISIGAAVTLAGIARMVPKLLGVAGRRAHRLPLGPRLALRDAARHWHRSAPATAAVATIVAGAVLVLFIASSTDVRGRRNYQPAIPPGMVDVALTSSTPTLADLTAAAARVQSSLHAPAVGVFSVVQGRGDGSLDMPFVHGCAEAQGIGACQIGAVGVADADAVTAVAGHRVPAAESVLARGGAVVFAGALAHGGSVAIDVTHATPGAGSPTTTTVDLVAAVVPVAATGSMPPVIVSPATAARHHWNAAPQQALLRPAHLPSTAAIDKLRKQLGDSVSIYLERGYHSQLGLALFLLVCAATLAALAGTSITVALAMAESRSDMATLAAIGASPARRRLHAMAQAVTVSGLGCGLGLPLGVLVGLALIEGSRSYPFTVPFRWMLLVVVVIPVVGAAVAGAATRSRIPLTRRLT